MQKSPITIEEDLKDLQDQSEEELQQIMKEFEQFFEPVTTAINAVLNPVRKVVEEGEADANAA